MWVSRISDRPGLVYPVALNMRDWDKREIYANRWDENPVNVAKDAITHGREVGWVAGLGETPIAAFGCLLMWPGVWSLWLFATDDFGNIGISMTKLIRHSILPMLWDAGAHRLEARSMDGHDDAQRWLQLIGARREATLRGYGRGGEDFHVFTWDRP